MSYPSIITQPGAAARNVDPIVGQLDRLLSSPSQLSDPTAAETPGKADQPAPEQRAVKRRRILEIGSYPYEHIRRFAERWPEWEWWGSGRDEGEVAGIVEAIDGHVPANLRSCVQLDIGNDDHWKDLADRLQVQDANADEGDATLEGILMINIIHCCPEGLPEQVFRQACTTLADGRSKPKWIAAYGPWLADDGSYKSVGDEQFDKDYIRAKHPTLGLRTISSIDEMARRWGYGEGERTGMPKGNTWIVWRAV